MDPLLAPLFEDEDRVDRKAVDAILARPDLGAALAEILRTEALWEDEETPAGWAPIHAAYLLAALRPPGSLAVLLEAVEHASEVELDLVNEVAAHLLAAYGPAALPALRAAGADVDRDPYLRVYAHEAIALIAWAHPEARGEALAILRGVVDDRRGDRTLRAAAALELLDFALPADRGRIEGAADGEVLKKDSIPEAYESGSQKREPLDWLSFYDPEEIRRRAEEDVEEETEESPEDAPPPPLQAPVEPGRNAPCPCGSGKKYKKCCLPQ